jgi:hypothetical protein
MLVRSPKVSFVIIGAMKAGTTALAETLRARPDVFLPEGEEQSFHRHWPTAFKGMVHPRSYERLFDGAPEGAVVGAKCSSTLLYPHALQGLRWYNRRVKLIALLRDPVDRAYSHWNMNRLKGREQRSFEEAVAYELAHPIRLWHYPTKRGFFDSYLFRGFYHWQCRTALWLFPRDQILFLKSERFRAEPEAAWADVCQFLGIEAEPLPEHWIRHARVYPGDLSPDLRARLAELYRADVAKLERLLQWDCADWLTGAEA